jgi:hypothetical protein
MLFCIIFANMHKYLDLIMIQNSLCLAKADNYFTVKHFALIILIVTSAYLSGSG